MLSRLNVKLIEMVLIFKSETFKKIFSFVNIAYYLLKYI